MNRKHVVHKWGGNMTKRLIDQIVYKLYGLTDEEIAIVEESFDG